MKTPTMQDLMRNPKAYGVPTFDEYCAAPDNYRKSFKRMMTEIELGPSSYRKETREIVYWVELNKCRTPERAVDIMLDMGWNPIHVESRIEPHTGTAGKLIFNVHFYEKKLEDSDEQVSGMEPKAEGL